MFNLFIIGFLFESYGKIRLISYYNNSQSQSDPTNNDLIQQNNFIQSTKENLMNRMIIPKPSDNQTELLNNKLINIIERLTKTNKAHSTSIQGVKLIRRETSQKACACFYQPSIILICQGSKQMILDKNTFVYDKHHILVTSLDLPVSSQILEATKEKPCLGLSISLERAIITELSTQMEFPDHKQTKFCSVNLYNTNESILEPILRLLSLMDEPTTIPILAPLIIKEIYYRLLTSDVATTLWQIITTGSSCFNIRKAIDWLKQNYTQPLKIDHLASAVHMSPSNLYHHFRQLTGKSPLQYQKWLRLNEARRLMINDNLDAATASYHVGYESPSHFSRDYKTIFGKPPKQDIKHFH